MMIDNCDLIEHPGIFIREELESRGWSQTDLAYILGCPPQSVNVILSGKRGISPEMAKSLADAFDVSAELFLNLQRMYDLSRAEDANPSIARRAKLQNHYPVREMINRGWLVDTDADLLEVQMARFFEVSSISWVPHLPHAAKKMHYEDVPPVQLAWLFRVKQIAKELIVPKYSAKKLNDSLGDLNALLVEPEESRHVPKILSECGVRLVFVEQLPSSKIDGVCFWINNISPVIGMSLRYDRIDNFWFVLRHEIEHVLRAHGKIREVIDYGLEGDRAGIGDSVDEQERVANIAGANFCVDQTEMNKFYLRKAPYISERDVLGFSARLGIHPGLVVGQIHNRTGKFNYLRKYLKPIRKHVLPSAVVDGWGEIAPVDL
ncbi:MAG TPA: HigA family addiction module antitoxin [Candidatus Competibacter sp.]|nr:HigA family addiction module antitoxin [Candidatus Competibacter sp.]